MAMLVSVVLYCEGNTECCSQDELDKNHSLFILKSRSCEVLELAVVIRGYSESRHTALLIKSVLLYRRTPIRWHFLTDPIAHHILSTLLRTWHLHGVAYIFYDIETFHTHSSDILTPQNDVSHFLLIIKTLSSQVKKVLVLSSNVLLTTDIFLLWEEFHSMDEHGRAIGIVRSLSENGRELRTEVVLLDFKSLKGAASKVTRNGENSSGDLNQLYTVNPSLFYELNPGWNVNLGTSNKFHSIACYGKQYICAGAYVNDSSKISNHLKQVFLQYDGNILREKFIDCVSGDEFDKNALDYRAKLSVYDPPCTDFTREGNQERRTHPFYLDYDYASDDAYDVTMVLHVTLDRLVPMLEPMCKHWEGPMSIAVFASDSEVADLLNLISSSPFISVRKNIGYHIVYKEGILYPINPLRIAAFENVRTPYVFFNDLDFLPSFGLYPYLKITIKQFNLYETVLVVPALETHENQQTFPFPHNKQAVVKLMSQERVYQFRKHKYIRGHAPTEYISWKKATQPYEIQWQPGFEPYLVASVNITPFDPRFVGRGDNKVSHAEDLYYQRYKFYVVPEGFIIHLPHSPSKDSVNQKASERYVECVRRRMKHWRSDAVKTYGNEPNLIVLYIMWNKLSSSYETSF